MKQSDRLQPISKINKQEERCAGRRHGDALRQAEQAQNQLDELVNYRDYYTRAFQSAGQSGLSVVQIQEYKLFLQRIDEAIAQQKHKVSDGKSKCLASQNEWMQKRSKCKMIDKVIEKRQLNETRNKERTEQKAIDDLPARPFTNL